MLADRTDSTHRQRTQNYIKTLESEVVRLRESETKLLEERDTLQGQIESLKTTVLSGNLTLPRGLRPKDTRATQSQRPPEFDMPATISYSTDDLAHERLQVSWPQRSSSQLHPSDFKDDPNLMQDFGSSPDFNFLPNFAQGKRLSLCSHQHLSTKARRRPVPSTSFPLRRFSLPSSSLISP